MLFSVFVYRLIFIISNRREVKNMPRREEKRNEKTPRKEKAGAISYRLKCAKTANGLSHFVMYGDVSKKKALL